MHLINGFGHINTQVKSCKYKNKFNLNDFIVQNIKIIEEIIKIKNYSIIIDIPKNIQLKISKSKLLQVFLKSIKMLLAMVLKIKKLKFMLKEIKKSFYQLEIIRKKKREYIKKNW